MDSACHSLKAYTPDDRKVPAAELLLRSVLDASVPLLLLSGRFGSGKTWLLRYERASGGAGSLASRHRAAGTQAAVADSLGALTAKTVPESQVSVSAGVRRARGRSAATGAWFRQATPIGARGHIRPSSDRRGSGAIPADLGLRRVFEVPIAPDTLV